MTAVVPAVINTPLQTMFCCYFYGSFMCSFWVHKREALISCRLHLVTSRFITPLEVCSSSLCCSCMDNNKIWWCCYCCLLKIKIKKIDFRLWPKALKKKFNCTFGSCLISGSYNLLDEFCCFQEKTLSSICWKKNCITPFTFYCIWCETLSVTTRF